MSFCKRCENYGPETKDNLELAIVCPVCNRRFPASNFKDRIVTDAGPKAVLVPEGLKTPHGNNRKARRAYAAELGRKLKKKVG